jgi:malonyl-CoA O-methyltransferase
MTEIQTLDPVAAYALWAATYPPHAHNPLMLAEERAMLALLGDLRGCLVLDAGCGSGRYLAHAHQRDARGVVGVDLSAEMLKAASALDDARSSAGDVRTRLLRGSLDALPIRDGWADVTICGLTIGHLADLRAPLAELRRVTRRGGRLLCSDFHPIGHALGWRREFRVGDRRFAVRHTPHLYSHWQHACTALGLRIVRVLEPFLEQADIPAGAVFDPQALAVPVAIVFELRRER